MDIKVLKEKFAKSVKSLVDAIDKMLENVVALDGLPSKDLMESICGLRRLREIVVEMPYFAEVNRLQFAIGTAKGILRDLTVSRDGLLLDCRFLISQQFLDEMRAWIVELEPSVYRFHKSDIEKAFTRFEKLRLTKGVRRGTLRSAYAEFEQMMLVAEEKSKIVRAKPRLRFTAVPRQGREMVMTA